MIFRCWDLETKILVYKYNEPKDKHICCYVEDFSFNEEKHQCGKDRFFYSKIDKNSNLIFAFCLDKIKVSKQAKFFVKHAINMFLSINPAIEKKQMEYQEVVKASIHNTKNLNSQITSKILRHLKEKELIKANDKIQYIDGLIKNNTHLFAKEVLSILKLSSQISSEYNVIDYIRPNIKIPKSEFSYGRIHSITVLSFYNFEYDFKKNNILVYIKPSYEEAYFNFNTIQTILSHMFNNALRYCKPNSTINIEIEIYDDDYIEISFKMQSLYLTDKILKEGFMQGERGEDAKLMYPKGSGLGLGIIKQLIELNKGSFYINRIDDSKITESGFIYGYNNFSIKLLKNEFY